MDDLACGCFALGFSLVTYLVAGFFAFGSSGLFIL